MKRLVPFLLVLSGPVVAQGTPSDALADTQLADPTREHAAKALMETLRCVVCQGQSIADSDAPMAGDMRALVRRRIGAGEAPERVRAWLVARYGDYVTYDPPFTGATAPLWIAPVVLLVLGLLVARASFQAAPLMGFAALILIAALAAAALWLLGIVGPLWRLVAAAAMLGAAGYAWQGSPALAGHPVAANAQPIDVDPGLVAFRTAIMPGEPGDAAVLSIADRHLEDGDAGKASNTLLAAIATRPRDAALWTALGTTLAAHDAQTLSPAARFAFARLSPRARSAGPPFFLGLVQVQAGEIAAARPAWQQALTLTPAGASYRPDIAERLATVDQFLAMQQGRTR